MKERGHFSQVSLLLRLERKRRRKEEEGAAVGATIPASLR